MIQPMLALRAVLLGLTLGAPAPVVSPAVSATSGEDGGRVALSYRTYRKWKILLPAEQFSPVGDGFEIPFSANKKYVAQLDGTSLGVDTDGDGKTDVRAEGDTAIVTLRGKHESGAPFTYAVRLDSKRGWRYAASGAMVGKIGSHKIQLIDQNNNGRYDDYGVDAMIVGRGRAASFLSRVINVDDRLWNVDVTADGTQLEYTPFEGATGALDVHSKFTTKAKLAAIVVRSTDGKHSFELSRADRGVAVPSGSYELHSGRIGLGQVTVGVRTGRGRPFLVKNDETTQYAWGGPIDVEFQYARSGENVQFSPDAVWYYGKSGEEYYNWSPPGKSPQFVIKDAKEDRELVVAKFGGC